MKKANTDRPLRENPSFQALWKLLIYMKLLDHLPLRNVLLIIESLHDMAPSTTGKEKVFHLTGENLRLSIEDRRKLRSFLRKLRSMINSGTLEY